MQNIDILAFLPERYLKDFTWKSVLELKDIDTI